MIAPSLHTKKRGVGTDSATNGVFNGGSGKAEMYPWSTPTEPYNPTVVPKAMLEQFHWMFLIRDPHKSIPSYFRCTIPPLDEVTGFYNFDPSEAGYVEVRLVFDYLRRIGVVGLHFAKGATNGHQTNGHQANGHHSNGVTNGSSGHANSGGAPAEICVIDADDMLDYPDRYIRAVCDSVHIDYTPKMLDWSNEADQKDAKEAFEKWKGFHEDAIDSNSLRAREVKSHEKPAKPEEQWDKEWKEKFGEKGAKLIRQTVDACMDDYLYMKQYALKL